VTISTIVAIEAISTIVTISTIATIVTISTHMLRPLLFRSCGDAASPDTHTIYGWNSKASDAPQWFKWLKLYAAEFELYAKYSHVDAMHTVRPQYCFATTAW
jgi:hypothetical protein